jgi:nucleoid DNA-binding protein
MYNDGSSKKLTKRGIAKYVIREAKTERPMNFQDMQAVVGKTLDCITLALTQGQTVELRNFGFFDVVKCKPRVGRNPKNPKITVNIPAKAKVRFRAGKEMKAGVGRLVDNNEPPRHA